MRVLASLALAALILIGGPIAAGSAFGAGYSLYAEAKGPSARMSVFWACKKGAAEELFNILQKDTTLEFPAVLAQQGVCVSSSTPRLVRVYEIIAFADDADGDRMFLARVSKKGSPVIYYSVGWPQYNVLKASARGTF